MNRRLALQMAGVVAALIATALIVGRPDGDGPPLDPDSVGELGTQGLVEFLERSGAQVRRGLPTGDVSVTLVLQDRLSGGQREDLLSWIQAGGTAVVADPTSPLIATGLVGTVAGDELGRGVCDIDALDGVNELDAAALALLAPVASSSVCFGDGDGAYILRFPDGDGVVTALGGALPFTNERLDEADNAVLAGRLLLEGDGSITVVYTPISSTADTITLGDLIGSNVRWFGWQLVVVAVVGLLWAARRFGSVVREPAVVELPGSLAVRATAELHRRARSAPHSVEVIHRSLLTRVRSEHRLPPEVDPRHAAALLAGRTGADADDIVDLLTAPESHEHDRTPLQHAGDLDRVGRHLLASFPHSTTTERTTDV